MAQGIARSASRTAAVLVLSLLVLGSGFSTDHARAAMDGGNRAEMLQLTNQARMTRDRDALELDQQLSRYAVKHSRAMATEGELFHSGDLAAVLRGRAWSIGGENVGVASSLVELQAAFMASRLHRQNILRRSFDHTAIGVVASDGRLWVTVIFYG
jgi:uncharacterized protein YkwD